MSQVRTRLRCEIYPNRVGTLFQSRFTGSHPKMFKGAGVDFEIALFDEDGELYDVSNVVQMSVLVRDSSGSSLMSKTTAVINTVLTLEDWQAGIGAHATISFTGTEASIAAAANHQITVHGVTSDNVADPDVFGTSTLECIDAGITGLTAPPLNDAEGVTYETLLNLLAGYVTFILPPGKTLTFQSSDAGKVKRIFGVANANPAGDPAIERVDKAEFES